MASPYAVLRAPINRAHADTVAGNRARLIRDESYYKAAMARCIAAELRSADSEEDIEDFLDEIDDEPWGFLHSFLKRNLEPDRVAMCLRRLGRVAEHMRTSFHITIVYKSLSCALPMAFHLIEEENRARRRRIDHASKPTSRIRGRIEIFRSYKIAPKMGK